jgi:hypothetical protein
VRSFVIGACNRALLEEEQMGYAFSMYGVEEMHVQDFDRKL